MPRIFQAQIFHPVFCIFPLTSRNYIVTVKIQIRKTLQTISVDDPHFKRDKEIPQNMADCRNDMAGEFTAYILLFAAYERRTYDE